MVSTILRPLAALLFCLLLTGAAVAQAVRPGDPTTMLVLRSTTERFAAGQMINGAHRLALPAGSRIALVDGGGRLRIVTGPFDGKPLDVAVRSEGAASSDGVMALLSALLAERAQEAALRGDMRSGAKIGKRPGPWAISVEQGGAACGQPDRVTFWRTEAEQDSRISIDMGARKANAIWKKGLETLPMPAAMFVSGRSYKAQVDGRTPVEFVLHLPAAEIASPVDQAVWMASVGCKQQALSVLDSLE